MPHLESGCCQLIHLPVAHSSWNPLQLKFHNQSGLWCIACLPAGTGKTTFLKALATHAKRSIINIPLSRIRTNQQLMSLMMDQQVRVRACSHRVLAYIGSP
jgi:AAA+ superfamily predicted ATPase